MGPPTTQRGLTPDEFRDVMGRFATGVTVITALHDGTPYGTTASAVSSLSLEPPMLLICMNKASSTGRAIAGSGRFAVNVLGEDHPDLAVRFARKGDDKFLGIDIVPGEHGEPLLATALATFECRVVEEALGGTHTVFMAEVERASGGPGRPLAYFRGQFGRLSLGQDECALQEIRDRIVQRELPAGRALSLDELARELDVPRGCAYYALSKLLTEGLVERDEAGSFVVPPVSEATSGACRAVFERRRPDRVGHN